MRLVPLAIVGILGIAASALPAQAAPILVPAPEQAPNVAQVAWGCGRGFHPTHWGRCVPNRWAAHRPYARWHRHYGARWQGYRGYGGGSPSDHVANQLNRQELGRMGY